MAEPAARGARWRRAAVVAVVAAAAIAPYLGILDAPFVFDDVKLVAENEHLRAGWEDPWSIVSTFDITSRRWEDEDLRPNYRPLRFLSYLLDYGLTRLWFGEFPDARLPPFFFHLTNVLLHAVNALLVLALGRRLLLDLAREGDRRAAGFAAGMACLFFALHPLATEAVTYVSGRRDVLSTVFYLLALVVYCRPGPREEPGFGTTALVPLCLAAGLLTKEMAATLPGALLLLDWIRGARWTRRRVAIHALAWGVSASFIAVNLSVANVVAPAAPGGGEAVLLTACRYVARYLGLILAPLGQSVDYSFDAIPPSRGWLEPPATLAALALVAAIAGVGGLGLWRARRAHRRLAREGVEAAAAPARRLENAFPALLALGLLWFLGTLLPVLQIVPTAERFAERFAYLPAIGILIIAAGGLGAVFRFRPRLARAAGAAICLLLLAATVLRNRDWQSSLALWSSAVEAEPRAARAHLGLANALKEDGRYREAAGEYTRALEIFREAPDLPLHHGFILQALTLRGQLYGLLGSSSPDLLERAIEDYKLILSLKDTDGVAIEGSPAHTVIHLDLAGFLLKRGRLEEAEREYGRVLEIGTPVPLVAAAHYYLAKIALARGEVEGAIASYERAIAATPGDDPVYFRIPAEAAGELVHLKRYDEADRLVERALERGPAGREKTHLLYRQAVVLERRGALDAARERLERLLERDPVYLPAVKTLAHILVTQGQLDGATARYAAYLDKQPGDPEAMEGLRELGVRKRAEEGDVDEDPRETELATLRSIAAKGAAHLDAGEILAAREVYGALLQRAHAGAERELELEAYRKLAAIEARLPGRSAFALAHLERAVALAPGNAEVLREMGDFQLEHGKSTAAARSYYERSLEALREGEAPDPRVYFNLANLAAAENPLLALEYCDKARAAGFDRPTLHRTLGYVHAALGHWESALDAFTRYLEGAPEGEFREKRAVRDYVKESVLPRLPGAEGEGPAPAGRER
jgi:tetratricopeptide (TPR) repeat protein